MGSFTEGPNFSTKRGSVSLDPRLLDILQTAAGISGLNVNAFDGVDSRKQTGTQNHPNGWAMDIELSDPTTGKTYSSYGADWAKRDVPWQQSFPVYEQFAQTARLVQEAKYPELDNTFRWGGYWPAANGNPHGPDMMHFDINPNANGNMVGSTWDGGANPSLVKTYGITSNGGLGAPEGIRLASLVKQSLAGSGGLVPPADVPGTVMPVSMPTAIAAGRGASQSAPASWFNPSIANWATMPQDAPFGVRLPKGTMTPSFDLPETGVGSLDGSGFGSLFDSDNPYNTLLHPAGTYDPIGAGPSFGVSAPTPQQTHAEQLAGRAGGVPAPAIPDTFTQRSGGNVIPMPMPAVLRTPIKAPPAIPVPANSNLGDDLGVGPSFAALTAPTFDANMRSVPPTTDFQLLGKPGWIGSPDYDQSHGLGPQVTPASYAPTPAQYPPFYATQGSAVAPMPFPRPLALSIPQAPVAPAPVPVSRPAFAPVQIGRRYTVQPGDTLSGISMASGVPVQQLASQNDISNPNKIRAGQTLNIFALPTSFSSGNNGGGGNGGSFSFGTPAPVSSNGSGYSAANDSVWQKIIHGVPLK